MDYKNASADRERENVCLTCALLGLGGGRVGLSIGLYLRTTWREGGKKVCIWASRWWLLREIVILANRLRGIGLSRGHREAEAGSKYLQWWPPPTLRIRGEALFFEVVIVFVFHFHDHETLPRTFCYNLSSLEITQSILKEYILDIYCMF